MEVGRQTNSNVATFNQAMFKAIYGGQYDLQLGHQMTDGSWQSKRSQKQKERENLKVKKVKSIKEMYKIGKIIGKGSSSQVRKAMHRRTMKRCALKLIRKSQIEGFEYLQDLINNELSSLTQVKHPSIIDVIELVHDNQFICIVTQFIEHGSLLKHCLKRRERGFVSGMPEIQVKYIAMQLFQAIHFLHQRQIVHRDINLENILVESIDGDQISIRLIDFGFSRYLPPNQKFTKQLGSEHYLAPEMLHSEFLGAYYDEKVDVWSTCVCLFILLQDELPFHGDEDEEVYKQINEKNIDFSTPQWEHISQQGKDFLRIGLSKSPLDRGSAKDMLCHPWLNANPEEENNNKSMSLMDVLSPTVR